MLQNKIQAYEILDETGTVAAAFDDICLYDKVLSLEKNKIPNGSSGKRNADGTMSSWDTFIPLKDRKSLTLKLSRLYTNVVSPFRAELKPIKLAKHPGTQKDQLGNRFTFTDFTFVESKGKSFDPLTIPKPDTIVEANPSEVSLVQFEATLAKGIISTGVWYAMDENGEEYRAYFDEKESEKDQNGIVKLKGSLGIVDLKHQPKKLTLHYKVAQKQNTDIDWKIEIPLTK
ncbi:hypothetical protein [Brevibacillus laterosporus]|uniref:hypothetical protein n=1 Tax=Brevibacillus laterosporus TaxID=1465 RepID=UPI00265304EA|nr:hypothetical protein [Brevibacillus laterosporus]MDN9010536.1 hypothetical protein [Brevibacillus laterosporus]MDO0941555.1 hypothetical protein [Brevibacillus laterosporus]